MAQFDKLDVFMKMLEIIEREQVVDDDSVTEEDRIKIATVTALGRWWAWAAT